MTEAPQGNRRLYEVRYEGTDSLLQATELAVMCEMVTQVTRSAGEIYEVSDLEYHATHVPEEELAATVVLTETGGDRTPYVVGEFGFEQSYRFPRKRCEPTVAADLFRQIVHKLSRS